MAISAPTQEAWSSPEPRRWTREEFEKAEALGLFSPEERLELIEGEIVVMAAMNSPHAVGIRLSEKAMNSIFGNGYDVRGQLPLALGERSEPQPDIAVVVGSARDYATAHPTTAVLIVEIADTTLVYDRTVKAAMYAKAGIQDYWILNLAARQLGVYRQPVAMPDRPLGYGYRSVEQIAETETVSPLVAPNAVLTVAELLP